MMYVLITLRFFDMYLGGKYYQRKKELEEQRSKEKNAALIFVNVDRIDKFKFHISGSQSNYLQFSIPHLTIFCSYSQYLIPHCSNFQ